MNIRSPRIAAALCAAILIATSPLAFADPGDMMHTTTSVKMQMSNAPVNIPAKTFSADYCVPKQHDARDIVRQSQRSKDCTVSNYKFTGSGGSFHYACTGNMQVEGDGSVEVKPGGGMHMAISTAGNMHGQQVSVDFTIDATPTGASCEYTPPAAAQ